VNFKIYIIFPVALGPGVHSASIPETEKIIMFLGRKVQQVRDPDNLAAICEPIF
jgi:hypothetical protein